MLKRILGALILLAVVIIAVTAYLMRPAGVDQARERWMSPEDAIVETAGQSWRVRISGPETAPALVLIHGFSHSLETWQPWAQRLQRDYRVIRFDLPGHALSGVREDNAYSVDDTLEQVSALLDAIAPERFIIGGNSLGGLIAWRYAADNPERVSALILVSPGGYPNLGVADEPAPLPDAVRFYLNFAPQAGVVQATAALYANPSRITPDQLERIGALMRVKGVGEALIARVEQFTLPDPEPDLARITAPALILWGEADRMIPPGHGPRFADAIPDAQLLFIEDAGHMAMEERPDETVLAVRTFLANLAAGAPE